jgi:hypothetical protein
MSRSQTGSGWFWTLVVLALAMAAGYYAYKGVEEGDDTPSCRAAQNTCLQSCRRTATESAAAQRCQQACQRDADACASAGR